MFTLPLIFWVVTKSFAEAGFLRKDSLPMWNVCPEFRAWHDKCFGKSVR
jgi:hypothetical protein